MISPLIALWGIICIGVVVIVGFLCFSGWVFWRFIRLLATSSAEVEDDETEIILPSQPVSKTYSGINRGAM